MKRDELATYTLLATGLILGAMVLLKASNRIESRAYAEMGMTKNSVTMITTASPSGDAEIIYILDSRSGQLYAYEFDPRGNIELYDVLDLVAVFAGDGGAPIRDGRRQR